MSLCDRATFFPSQIKRLKDLEKEKDALCSGLEILEKTRLWYLQRLEENRARQDSVEAGSCREDAVEVQGRAGAHPLGLRGLESQCTDLAVMMHILSVTL